ncbi:MAG: PilZ domain-containing protein, partial [Deefgea sp.]
ESEPQAVSLTHFDIDIETQKIEIEVSELQSQLVHKYLTLIGNWHEYRIAFSSEVLAQLSRHRLTLAWPAEIIHTTGREYYRLHPAHKVPVFISTPAGKLACALYDLSEGGIGLNIAASDQALFQALSGNEVLIELVGQRLVTQLHICSFHAAATTTSNTTSRIGLAFTHIAIEEQAKLRKLILQLQSRH